LRSQIRILTGLEALDGGGNRKNALPNCCKFVTLYTIRNGESRAAAKLGSFVAPVYAPPGMPYSPVFAGVPAPDRRRKPNFSGHM
jgi:hypothetical protein